jgi:hypothetical protein
MIEKHSGEIFVHIPVDQSKGMLSFSLWFVRAFPELADDLSAVISKSHEGLDIDIHPHVPMHSRSQENYYRKWCGEFAAHCGMTPDEMHEELLCICWGSAEVSTPFGIKRRPLKRSGGAKRGDYSTLIETLTFTAGQMGFEVPPPATRAKPKLSIVNN